MPTPTHSLLGLIAASLGLFLGALDTTVNVALPAITDAFETDIQTIQWIIVVYVGTTTGLQLILGKLADAHGLKRFYLVGITVYTLAVGLIGLAPTLSTLFALRVVQAVGIGFVLATGPALVTRIAGASGRGRGLGLMTGIGALGMITGTLGGGFLVDAYGWHMIFLARVPIALLVLAMALFVLEEPARGPAPRFDARGATALFIGFLCTVLYLNLGGRLGWTSPFTLFLAGTAVVGLAFFIRIERQVDSPILHLDVFANSRLAPALAAAFLVHMATFVNLFILPFAITEMLKAGAAIIGIMLMINPITTVVAAPIAGWLSDRFDSARVAAAALVCIAVSMFWLSDIGSISTPVDLALRLGALGLGMGAFQASNTSTVMGSVPPERLGSGAALNSLTLNLGMVTSVGVLSAVFAGALSAEGNAFEDAFRYTYRIAAALAVVAALISVTSAFRQGTRDA